MRRLDVTQFVLPSFLKGASLNISQLVFCSVCGFICSIGTTAFSAELVQTWTSARALAMGNAYTAVVSDTDSLFYNPAGLARSSGFHWVILDPRVGLNGEGGINAVKDFTESEDMAQLFNDLYGNPLSFTAGAKSAFQIGGLAFGAFSGTDFSANLSNPAYPNFDLKYNGDYGFNLGIGFDFIPGLAKFGIVGRWINRVGTSLPIGASTMATLDGDALEEQLKNRGTGYGLDLGWVFTIPSPIQPSLSFVWRDVGNTQFEHQGGAQAPTRIDSEMIVGGAVEISVPLISITPSFDYRYVNREDVQMGRKIHLGLEISLPLISIRAGLNEGYYTAGAGLDMGLFRIDVATYGVELGEYPGQLEDRRYMAQLALELGFDPSSFGFGGSGSGGGGGGRRLKQRR